MNYTMTVLLCDLTVMLCDLTVVMCDLVCGPIIIVSLIVTYYNIIIICVVTSRYSVTSNSALFVAERETKQPLLYSSFDLN